MAVILDNSGKKLEAFVKRIEEILIPQGFKVETRKRMFSGKGKQSAELDIVVSGSVGTTKFDWLIECRDRPSDGSAPAAWIEQLVGRRKRLGVDKITAVSSTGFAPDAITFAQQEGIEIRTLSEITDEEIRNWWKTPSITAVYNSAGLVSANLNMDEATDQQKEILKAQLIKLSGDDPFFIDMATGSKSSIMDIWRDTLNQNTQLFNDVEPNKPPQRKRLSMTYPKSDRRFKAVVDGVDVEITRIDFVADISISTKVFTPSMITRYSKNTDNSTIANSVHFKLSLGADDIDLVIDNIPQDTTTKLVVSAKKFETQKATKAKVVRKSKR